MTIPTLMQNDHAELRALAEDILNSAAGPDAGGRDNQFDLYDMQLRRHLAVMEEVLFPLADGDEHPGYQSTGLKSRHDRIRKELKRLDRRDKNSPGWAAEFRGLSQEAEEVSREHERLIQHGRENHAEDYRGLSDRYERAKIKRMKSAFSWNRFPEMPRGRTGTAAAAAAGAAALAGAAYAASRYFRSGRRASGRSEDDFELRLETDENMRLISSKKVEGTEVYGRDGEKLGTIDNFMVDKYTGRVAYAAMRFGGHFGFGEHLFPLPWAVLDYDEEMDGYMVDITKEELSNAPRFEASDQPEWTPAYRRRILIFYRPAEGYSERGMNEDRSGSSERRESSGITEGGPGFGSQGEEGAQSRETQAAKPQREPSSV